MGNIFIRRLLLYFIALCLLTYFVYFMMQFSTYFVFLGLIPVLTFPIVYKKCFNCPLCSWPSFWDKRKKFSWIASQCRLCGLNFVQTWNRNALHAELLRRAEKHKNTIDHQKRGYPKLSRKLKHELSLIRPIKDEGMIYYPCDVKLANGEEKRNVVVVEAGSFLSKWGIAPNVNRGVKIEEVVSIIAAANRLPEPIEQKLTQIYETRMGGVDFRLILRDGSEVTVCTGNFKYFLDFKNRLRLEDIADVRAVDRNEILYEPEIENANYYWCLYS